MGLRQTSKTARKNCPRIKMTVADSRQLCKMVDKVQSQTRNDLFAIDINANFLRDEKVLERKLRPWLERKIDIIMGGPQSDLVETVLRKINGASTPDALINDLRPYLEDFADPI